MNEAINVFGEPLECCSQSPLTGFTRSGDCQSTPEDLGVHSVCIQATAEFLEFSFRHGNDLSTPVPAFDFPGLKPGDRWCLCAARWLEAFEAGKAPPVVLRATHRRTLDLIAIGDLKSRALDLS